MSIRKLLFLLFITTGLMVTTAHAGSLKDYKKQKHTKRKRVNAGSCLDDYVNRCTQSCKAGDKTCVQTCRNEAPGFCSARKSKRTTKKWELAAKGVSLGVGSLGVILDKPMAEVSANGTQSLSPYSIIWNRTEFVADMGGGTLSQGGSVASGHMRIRRRWYGFGANYSYLSEKGDYLSEADFGPTFSFASSSFLFALQPSAIVSGGNGVDQVWGGGLRTYTRLYLGRLFLLFDPMLGYINENWQYHAKIGAGFRITPNFGFLATFEYRDLVDLNDLDISTASLQSGMGYLQLRF